MLEQNKAVVWRLVDEVMNAGRMEVIDELYSPKARHSYQALDRAFP